MSLRETAVRRVEAAWTCVNALCPELAQEEKKVICEKLLDMCRGEATRKVRISPAQAQEIIWRNLQCANRHCSAVLFANEAAEELNAFFSPE